MYENNVFFNGRMDKKDVVHTYTMGYYLVIIKKESLPKTWMNLEDIMLSEMSQSQKDKYCMMPEQLNSWRYKTEL